MNNATMPAWSPFWHVDPETHAETPAYVHAPHWYDQLTLFCTGLPFCNEDTHFKDTGLDDVIPSCSQNREKFQELIGNHVKECLEWKHKTIAWLKADADIASRFSDEKIAESMNKCSTWYCHSIGASGGARAL